MSTSKVIVSGSNNCFDFIADQLPEAESKMVNLLSQSERRRRLINNFIIKLIRASAKFKVVESFQKASLTNKSRDSCKVRKKYLPPNPNAKYDLSIRDGLLHLGNSELPYTTDPQADETIICMDWRLTIRVRSSRFCGYDRVFHSTLFSAANLRFAGIVEVDQGYITIIDNDSGHYQPTERDILGFARTLMYLGVNLSKATLIIKDDSGNEIRRAKAVKEIENSPDIPKTLQCVEACQAVMKRRRVCSLSSLKEVKKIEAQEECRNVAPAKKGF